MITGRRRFLEGGAAAAIAAVLSPAPGAAQDAPPGPPSAAERTQMAEAAAAFMAAHDVPGLGVAIAKGGRVLYDEAFGLADREEKTALTPAHRFRIASVSKPITAVAIFRLIEDGKIALDERAVGTEGILKDDYGAIATGSRIGEITVGHLLAHTAGGWSNDTADPMFQSHDADHASLIRTTLAMRPLTQAPGTTYAYSNFGYCLLGRIVEKVTRQPYAAFVQQAVLAPSGAEAMEIAGNTLAERRPLEVRYYGRNKDDPYRWNVARMDSHGGWMATASALVRFAGALDGARPLLKPETVATMTTPGAASNGSYALGWRTNKAGNVWHAGALPGTATILVRTRSGLRWAALINTRNREDETARDLDRLMWTMARKVPHWRA